MHRLKLWKLNYFVNNDYSTINYGCSVLRLCTPFFGVIFRISDCIPNLYAIRTGIEISWQFNFKKIQPLDNYYEHQAVLVHRTIGYQELYLKGEL